MKFLLVFCTVIHFSSNVLYINGQENVVTSRTSIKPVTNYFYQTNGFNSSNVTSGPILIIDKKTIFISNLDYSNRKSITNFWVGSGKPSSSGTLVPDENGSSAGLKTYSARNIYLQLPGNSTTNTIDYLGIWSPVTNTDMGHVMLYNDNQKPNIPEASEFYNMTQDNKVIFRVPKCCELNQFFKENSTACTSRYDEDMKIEYRIYESNETHIDPDNNITNVEFVPYYYQPECGAEHVRVELMEEEDTYGLIYNSSLIYVGSIFENNHGIYPHGKFCMENREGTNKTIFFKCEHTPITNMSKIQGFYFPFLIISTICFLLSTICFKYILKEKDIHRKCIIGYSTWMTVTFICLICFHKNNGTYINCNILGSVYMFSTFSSFVWLTYLCVDMLHVVKSFTKYSNQTRFYFYISSSIVIPSILLMSSLIPDGIPDIPGSFIKDAGTKPNGTCLFNDHHNVRIVLFFAPTGILLVISLLCLVGTSYVIRSRNDLTICDWIDNKSRLKFMLQSCFLIWIIACICIVAAITTYFNTQLGDISLIEACQGIFFALIFVLNKYTRKEIFDVINKEQTRRKRDKQYIDLVDKLALPTPDETNRLVENGIRENGDEIRQHPV